MVVSRPWLLGRECMYFLRIAWGAQQALQCDLLILKLFHLFHALWGSLSLKI